MRVRDVRRIILIGIWLWSVTPLEAQSLPVPRLLSPRSEEVYAWGRKAPSIRIEVQAAPSSTSARNFVTANVFTVQGQLVDRVSLFDDGSHFDASAGDGVFTNVYTPPEEGAFRIRARLQQTEISFRTSREKWSGPVVFSVKRVPYVDITSPQQDAKISSVTKVSASLLVGSQQQLYRPANGEVRIRCWAAPEAETTVPKKPSGNFSVRVEFPRPGKYRLFMAAQTLHNGQWIESEPDSVWVNVVRPPIWLFVVGTLLLVTALLLPPKQVWLYRHILHVCSGDGNVYPVEVYPQGLKEVVFTVGGVECDKKIPGVQGTLFTLAAKPGEQSLLVDLVDAGGNFQQKKVRPCLSTPAFMAGNMLVYYKESKPVGKKSLPFWQLTTVPKRVLCTLAALALLYGVWIYWQFIQMLPSS